MRFTVSTEPVDGFEVGKSYNHAREVCRNGHDECSERRGGRCLDDVVFVCRVCRGPLIRSEIQAGICGHDSTSLFAGSTAGYSAPLEEESR